MQRNLRNEIMIAVGAVLIIVFALLFAVLLSGNPEEPTSTAVVQVSSATESSTQEADSSATATARFTDDGITITPTNTATNTEIPSKEPSLTPSEEASPTEIPATATETETATEVEASATSRSIGRATREPSSTATNTESNTETNTPRPSNTTRPTRENTATATESPTNTVIPSPNPRPSLTALPPNVVLGIIPTPPPSPTVAPLTEASRTPATCDLPQGWTTYTLLSGNTLFAVALATNSTVDELRHANCIANVDNVIAGDTIFVPRTPLRPVAALASGGIRGGLAPLGCTSSSVQITSPISAQAISGTFTVYGTASRSDFLYYKIEIRPDAASIYNFYSDSHTQVTNGVLGEVNSELFDAGLHWLKLTVVDLSANIPADATCEIPVIFK